MEEILTLEIAKEYQRRAGLIVDNSLQDTGERRKLRKELQERCNLTELQALNIINGFHVKDYIMIEERKERKNGRDTGGE